MISGILISFVLIWALKDWSDFNFAKGCYFTFFAIIALGEAAILTQWLHKTSPH